MNNQDMEKILKTLLVDNFNDRLTCIAEEYEDADEYNINEALNEINRLIKQDRELYGIECEIKGANKAKECIRLWGEETTGDCVCNYRIDECITELQTKKDNLIKGVE